MEKRDHICDLCSHITECNTAKLATVSIECRSKQPARVITIQNSPIRVATTGTTAVDLEFVRHIRFFGHMTEHCLRCRATADVACAGTKEKRAR